VESPANKPSGEGMQDTPTTKPIHDRFGTPPQPAPGAVDKGMSGSRADGDACKGSTDTPGGATFRAGTTSKLKNGGPAKRSPTARDEGVTGSKSRASVALAGRACQKTCGGREKPPPFQGWDGIRGLGSTRKNSFPAPCSATLAFSRISPSSSATPALARTAKTLSSTRSMDPTSTDPAILTS